MTDFVFGMNLQLFGGGGSSSGLGGGKGGEKGKGKDKSGGSKSKGYLFYFFKDGKQYLRWVEGNTPNNALKNAEDIAKKNGLVVGNPMGNPITYDEAKKIRPSLKNASAKK